MVEKQSLEDNLRKDEAKDSVFVVMMMMATKRSVVRIQHVLEETTAM